MEQQTKTSLDPKFQRWSALASFLLAVNFIVPNLIYLTGNVTTVKGQYAYRLADFLYGPVWSVCLIVVILVLREQLSKDAPRRITVATFTAFLAAGTMIVVTFIRASNREYHILHPELHLEESVIVLTVWTTLLAGLTAAGWHFLGWAQIMIASSGWTSQRLPRVLSALYLVSGIASLFVYLFPVNEGFGILLSTIIFIWQGILFWNVKSKE